MLVTSSTKDWIVTGDFAPTAENAERIRRIIEQWLSEDRARPLVLGGGLQVNFKDETGWHTFGCNCKQKASPWSRFTGWLGRGR